MLITGSGLIGSLRLDNIKTEMAKFIQVTVAGRPTTLNADLIIRVLPSDDDLRALLYLNGYISSDGTNREILTDETYKQIVDRITAL